MRETSTRSYVRTSHSSCAALPLRAADAVPLPHLTLVGRFLFSVILVAFLVGCQTERITSDGRPLPPTPRAAPSAPSNAQANRMMFMVGAKPRDTNGNGYPDQIEATVALFASPHPTAIHQEGVFEFALFTRGHAGEGAPIAQWRVEGDMLERARARTQYGPCYQFQLSLLDAGGDVYPLTAADLRCTFIPADGSPPVRSDGVRSIQIGKR